MYTGVIGSLSWSSKGDLCFNKKRPIGKRVEKRASMLQSDELNNKYDIRGEIYMRLDLTGIYSTTKI